MHPSSCFWRTLFVQFSNRLDQSQAIEKHAHNPSNRTAEASRVQIPAQDSSHRSSNGDWLTEEVVERHARKERRVLQQRLLQTTMSQEFSFFFPPLLVVSPPTIKKTCVFVGSETVTFHHFFIFLGWFEFELGASSQLGCGFYGRSSEAWGSSQTLCYCVLEHYDDRAGVAPSRESATPL